MSERRAAISLDLRFSRPDSNSATGWSSASETGQKAVLITELTPSVHARVCYVGVARIDGRDTSRWAAERLGKTRGNAKWTIGEIALRLAADVSDKFAVAYGSQSPWPPHAFVIVGVEDYIVKARVVSNYIASIEPSIRSRRNVARQFSDARVPIPTTVAFGSGAAVLGSRDLENLRDLAISTAGDNELCDEMIRLNKFAADRERTVSHQCAVYGFFTSDLTSTSFGRYHAADGIERGLRIDDELVVMGGHFFSITDVIKNIPGGERFLT